MGTYILRRCIQAVFIMFGLSVVFFLILHLTPGGPCAAFDGPTQAAQAKLQQCIRRLGVDRPLIVQYTNLMGQYLHGNLGTSNSGDSVVSIFAQKLPATLLLMGSSYLLQQMIALPLGVFAALKQYSFFDQVFTFLSYVGLSMPTFWLGIMLIFFFSVQLNVFPAGHIQSATMPLFWSHDWFVLLGQNPGLVLGDLIKHLALPCFVLMITGVAVDSRYMRASMLEVIRQDYIRTARAKGLSRRVVIFKHAFRNALLPIITNIGLYLPALIGGAIITETIFSWGGLGYYFFTAIVNNDYPVVQGLSMLSALAVLAGNLLADITYAWVDPRIRYD
ncbi:MAG TPA: ABC transporter permease [Chloroflexota bacterium]|nr:ABC transporter permease [Chloroflexota bacterium]